MNKQNFYKVYETLDNDPEDSECPTYFVGAFQDKERSNNLCKAIDICDCNSTKIVYGEITKKDVVGLKKFGLHAADKAALVEINNLLTQQSIKENDLTI